MNAKVCPVTDKMCYNYKECISIDGCAIKESPSEKTFEKLLERLELNIFEKENKETWEKHTINQLVKIIGALTQHTEHHHKSARYFGIELTAGENINSVSFYVKNKQKHMSVSFKQAGGATATLSPLAADGVTPAPNGVDLTKPVTAVSSHPEFFTATVVVDTNGVPTLPLQVTLKGVADGAGTITYGATSIDGTALTLVDNVTVADVPPIVPAASFTVEYTVF